MNKTAMGVAYDTKTAEEPDKKEEKRGAGPGGSVGWVCPVCGRGMSPYAHSCPCRGFGEVTCSVTC